MLDERVLTVLARMEEENRAERDAGVKDAQRARQVPPTTGRFLFALAASQAGIEGSKSEGHAAIRRSGWQRALAFWEDDCSRSSTIR